MNPQEFDRFVESFQGDLRESDRTKVTQAIEGFLGPAEEDLKACMILYNAELFAFSTYHLQQGTEKATKAFLLSSNLISLDEIKAIGHDSLKGHILLVKKFFGYLKEFNEFGAGLTKALEYFDILKKINREKIARSSYEEIIGSINVLDLTIKKDSQFMASLSESLRDVDKILKQSREVDNEDNQFDVAVNKKIQLLKEGIENGTMLEVFAYLPTLFLASIFTYPHEAFTRYSDGNIKPKDYTLDMGIVRATPELCQRVTTVIQFIEKDNTREN